MRVRAASAFWVVFAIALVVTGPVAAQPVARGEEVRTCSQPPTDGTRTLCHEILVPMGREAVWALVSGSEGLSTWAAPLVLLDLRIGGLWEASYRRDARAGDPANIRNRVLSYAPGRMLSIQVDRPPPGFPHPDLVVSTWSVIELQDEGPGATRVRVSGMGYGSGAGFDELYAFFDRGNAWTLEQLRTRVVDGPTDWTAVRAPGGAP